MIRILMPASSMMSVSHAKCTLDRSASCCEFDVASSATITQLLRATVSAGLEIDEDDELAACSRAAITQDDIIYVTNQLAVMVDTGITLSAAWAGIVEQEAKPDAAERAQRAQTQPSKAGDDFSSAWPSIPKCSTRPTFRWSRPAKRPAKLGEMLDRIANYLRKEVETAARSARRWPIRR